MSDHYEPGQWNALCDRCGFKFKARQLRKEWTGLMVCSGSATNDCWEPRNAQEKLRAKADRQSPPWVRPDTDGTDVSPGSGNEVSSEDL